MRSLENFRACVQALKSKPIYCIRINWFDEKQVRILGEEMNKAMRRINFCYLSNLPDAYRYHEDQTGLARNLQLLPFHESCRVIVTAGAFGEMISIPFKDCFDNNGLPKELQYEKLRDDVSNGLKL